jgi:hypothetical protein
MARMIFQASEIRQPTNRSKMEAAPPGTIAMDRNSDCILADSIYDCHIYDDNNHRSAANAELPDALSHNNQDRNIFFCNSLECDDDSDEECENILREHECEASCYYSQSATLFEDDDSDKDFVSTSGRQTAIMMSSYGFLRLCHSVISRTSSSRRSAVSGTQALPSQSIESISRHSSVKGLLKNKVKLSIVMLRLLSQAKPSALENFAAANIDDTRNSAEDDDMGSDCEDFTKTEAQSRFLLARRTSSMRRSIQDFEARRERVQHLVQNGTVVVEHEKYSRPRIEKQGDFDVYKDDQLLLRSTIKRSPPFREKVMQFWTLILNTEKVIEIIRQGNLICDPCIEIPTIKITFFYCTGVKHKQKLIPQIVYKNLSIDPRLLQKRRLNSTRYQSRLGCVIVFQSV